MWPTPPAKRNQPKVEYLFRQRRQIDATENILGREYWLYLTLSHQGKTRIICAAFGSQVLELVKFYRHGKW